MAKAAKKSAVRPVLALPAALFFFCTAAVFFLFRIGTYYNKSFDDPQLRTQAFEELLSGYADELGAAFRIYYRTNGAERVECPPDLMPGKTNLRFVARDADSGVLLLRNVMEITAEDQQKALFYTVRNLEVRYAVSADRTEQTTAEARIVCMLPQSLPIRDDFRSADTLIRIGQAVQPFFWSIGVICGALTLLFAGLFLRSAYREGRQAHARPRLFRELPPDLAAAAVLPAIVFLWKRSTVLWQVLTSPWQSLYDGGGKALLLLPLCCAGFFAVLLWWLSLLLFSLRRGGVRYTISFLRYENAPFTRMTLPMLLLMQPVKAGAVLLCRDAVTPKLIVACLLLEKVIVLPVLYRCLREIRTIYDETELIAKGDLTRRIAGRKLYRNLRRHAKDIDCIAERISQSANEYIRSSQFKAELLTNLSHDIKTPLTSIINYAALLQDPTLSAQDRARYLEVLHRHAQRLDRLVEDLRQAGDTEAGRIRVRMQRFNVCSLVVQSALGFEERLQKKQIAIRFQIPDDPVFVTADLRLLWRVSDNLMNNICKYAKPGTETLIAVQQSADDVTLCYTNVPEDPLEIAPDALMERFVRADNSRHSEGSGLGLSIARSLLDVQGGSIRLETAPDRFTAVVTLRDSESLPGKEASYAVE